MSKLGKMPSRLSSAPSRFKTAAGAPQRELRDLAPWRKWYHLARWRDLRWSVLVDANFTCVRCKRFERNSALLVADHEIPHRGDPDLFWDLGNLQCLCKPCHDRHKQAEERAAGW